MLTSVQIPGLYLVSDKSIVMCFDNLEAKIKEDLKDKLLVELINPTGMDANIKIWQEKSSQISLKINHFYLKDARHEMIQAGSSRILVFPK